MPDKKKLTDKLKDLKGCFVAGGAITSLYTNKPINDFDIYPKTMEALEGAIRWAYESSLWNADATSRSLTFGKQEDGQVQIMHFDVFPSAEAIFEAFDFTCCMGAFDLDTEQFVLHERFLEHCSQRFLKFNMGTRFPYASAWRVRKYEERGYTIGKMEFHKILMACAERPIKSWDDLRNQIGGVYGEAFDIPENEPFSMDAALRAISTLRFDKTRHGYGSADEAILLTGNTEREYFVLDNKMYARLDDEYLQIGTPPKNGKLVPIHDAFSGMTFYKKVVKKDDKYISHWKNTFLYPMGETVSSGEPYIYAYQSLRAAANHYSGHGPGHALIELKATDPDDIVFDGRSIRLKKCIVVAERPAPPPEAPQEITF